MGLPDPTPTATAVVTGASQGIGKALAHDLAALGHNVTLVARRAEVLEQIADELTRKFGVEVTVYPCDLADAAARAKLCADLANWEVSIIINSAGVASFGPFAKANWDYEQTQFELNGRAVFDLTHAVIPQMIKRGSGAICNVGSAAGNMPIPNNATYVFTKAGVNAFTEALHYELKPHGINCTLLAPGPVREAVIPDAEKTIVDRVVPDFTWTTYESCAKETLAALAKNQRRVVPGPLGKAMNAVSQIVPTAVLAPVMGWFYAKMATD